MSAVTHSVVVIIPTEQWNAAGARAAEALGYTIGAGIPLSPDGETVTHRAFATQMDADEMERLGRAEEAGEFPFLVSKWTFGWRHLDTQLDALAEANGLACMDVPT